LRVKEYFLLDPLGDYLDPSLQGHRLRGGQYHPIRAVAGRLPSRMLGLHLERGGRELRLYDPAAERWLPTPLERADVAETALQFAEMERLAAEAAQRDAEAAQRTAEEAQRTAEAARQLAQVAQRNAEVARQQSEEDNERPRRELAETRRRLAQEGDAAS
jgi:hypothetical protein